MLSSNFYTFSAVPLASQLSWINYVSLLHGLVSHALHVSFAIVGRGDEIV